MPSLPSGTVTFLLTDIEASTRLWERDRQAMYAAVERHLALLREAVTEHRGILYKTIGDGTQSAFPTAPDALRAALSAQRALLAESWPSPPGPLRVRMALHAGEAEPKENDYLAAPLNRLSRVLGMAQGGQILLTEAVEQLAQDDLPTGSTLRELGEVRLRDLERAERVFALLHPELPDTMPALLSADERLRGFPATLTPFLGREPLVNTVSALLRAPAVRLLTLTGPGGTGKTRLAMRVAEASAADFTDGVVFVDLASLRDPALVLSAIATALGLREGAGRSLEDVVHGYLRERQILLLLDNFEHLLPAAPVVRSPLVAGDRIKVLVTSREPLRLRGEHEYPIPSLSLPGADDTTDLATLRANEAVALFVDRAQAVKPDLRLSAEAAAVVAEICTRLDGLPLAIELAAARVKVLPPPALLTRLERRLPLLTTGARDAPERQRTLRDAIAWSYDLLSPAEQTLFRRLGVFVGGWTLDAAEAIANMDGELDVLEGLASLVDKSLVRLDESGPTPRYRMLETIREFAVEQLSRNREEGLASQRAHARYFADLALSAQRLGIASGTLVSFRLIRSDEDNFRAMLAHLLDSGDAETALRVAGGCLREDWIAGGRLTEGLDWLNRALRQGHAASADARAWAQYGVTILALYRGDLATARIAATECLALTPNVSDPDLKAYGLFALGWVEGAEGRLETTSGLAERTVAAARESGNPETQAWALLARGIVERRSGDHAEAAATLTDALALFRGFGGIIGAADVLTELAVLARASGDIGRAVRLLYESLHTRHEAGFGYGVYEQVVGLADMALEAGMYETAALLLGGESDYRALSGHEGFGELPEIRERVRRAVSEQLGDERFRQAWERGRALPHAARVAEALKTANALEMEAATNVTSQ